MVLMALPAALFAVFRMPLLTTVLAAPLVALLSLLLRWSVHRIMLPFDGAYLHEQVCLSYSRYFT